MWLCNLGEKNRPIIFFWIGVIAVFPPHIIPAIVIATTVTLLSTAHRAAQTGHVLRCLYPYQIKVQEYKGISEQQQLLQLVLQILCSNELDCTMLVTL